MTAWAKFLFDTDFAVGETARPNPAVHRTAIAEAEARGYRNGVAAGKAEAIADTQRQMAVALDRTAAALELLVRGLGTIEARLEAEAVEVAVAVAGKLASSLVAREPSAEIESLASECFRHLVTAPHVVVWVNDAQHDEMRSRLGEIGERCSYSGRVVVLADPDIALGDCRIEWADGGAERNRVMTESAIAAAVERYLAAGCGHATEYASRSSTP